MTNHDSSTYHHVPAPALTVGELQDKIRYLPREALVEILIPQVPTCHPEIGANANESVRFDLIAAGLNPADGMARLMGDFIAGEVGMKEHLLCCNGPDCKGGRAAYPLQGATDEGIG